MYEICQIKKSTKLKVFFENWSFYNRKRLLGPKIIKITPFCGLIYSYLFKKLQTYFNGYFAVKASTIALALGAAASPSLIIMAIASAI